MTGRDDPAETLYSATSRPQLVDVPDRTFLAIDGTGDPERSLDFQLAVEALFAVAEALKFGLQVARKTGFAIPPLEALWWTDENRIIDLARKTASWHWRVMIAIPDGIPTEMIEGARARAAAREPNPALDRLRTVRYAEGLCVQILHVGPYSKEQGTIERMHAFARRQSRELRGRHHEIYLGDPRGSSPEELRTILRQPVA